MTVKSRPAVNSSVTTREVDVRTVAAVVVALIYLFFFTAFLDESVRGLGDGERGIAQFSKLSFYDFGFSLDDQVYTRLMLALGGALILSGLVAFRLIKKSDMQFFLIWPYSVYLVTKIKLEFFYFIVCQIRTDLGVKKEGLMLLAVFFVYYLTQENNFLVFIVYRAFIQGYLRFRIAAAWSLAAFSMAAIFYLDNNISSLFGFIPDLKKYEYTRDLVNPEYSVLETAQVLFCSLHLSVWVQTDWVYHAVFSLIILALCINNKEDFLRLLGDHRVVALFTTIILFTSITHAFQNARYYYFFLPLLSEILGKRFYAVMLVGLAHALTMSFVYGLR